MIYQMKELCCDRESSDVDLVAISCEPIRFVRPMFVSSDRFEPKCESAGTVLRHCP